MGTSINPHPSQEREFEPELAILREGKPRLSGIFPLGSNATFFCELQSAAGYCKAVYKPSRGERPLWDFPVGTLGKREAAAFLISQAAGWRFVPPTVFRADGPYGPGSYQQYLELDFHWNYFTLREVAPDCLRSVAAFDLLINNADRKAMHISRDDTGRLWLIDHGICFHADWKLRTVIWDFAGEAMADDILESIGRIQHSLRGSTGLQLELDGLLDKAEIAAMGLRVSGLLEAKTFPLPGPGRNVPWPIWA